MVLIIVGALVIIGSLLWNKLKSPGILPYLFMFIGTFIIVFGLFGPSPVIMGK